MAINLDAILRVVANIKGLAGINQLSQGLDNVKKSARSATDGFRSMEGAISGLVGGLVASRVIAFGTSIGETGAEAVLVERRIRALAGSYGEVTAVTGFATEAANKFALGTIDARNAVADLYARLRPMGVGMKDIESIFIGVNNATKIMGLSAFDAKEAFRQLGQALGSGRLQGDEFRSIMERMPAIGISITKVFNDIARSSGLPLLARSQADKMIEEAKRGEKRQSEIMKQEIDYRMEAMERETDRRLKELNKRYRREEQVLNDRFDDINSAAEQKAEEQTDSETKAIEKRFDVLKRQHNREMDARRKLIQGNKLLSDQYADSLIDELEDESIAYLDKLREREEAELDTIRNGASKQSTERGRAFRDQRQAALDAIQTRKEAEEQALRDGFQSQKTLMEQNLKNQIEANKQATSTMVAGILARTQVTVGDLKKMASEGMITTEIMVLAAREMENLKPPAPTEFERFGAEMKNLALVFGETFIPVLRPVVGFLGSVLQAFQSLPGPVKTIIAAVTIFTVAIAGLAAALLPLIVTIATLVGAGALAAVAPILLGIVVAFVLVIAQAGIAIATFFLFKDKVAIVFSAVLKTITGTFDLLKKAVVALWGWFGDRFKDLTGFIQSLADGAVQILSGIAGAVRDAFMAIPNMLRTAINAALAWAGNAVNGLIGVVNGFIQNANRLANAVRLPGLPLVPTVPIPQFATGAYVTGATTAMIGEAGQPEYVIPADRMAAASTAYLQGARGINVVNGTRGGGGGGGRSITVNTGPIMQQPDGSRWASLDDLERGIASAVDQAVGIVASPAGRMATWGA